MISEGDKLRLLEFRNGLLAGDQGSLAGVFDALANDDLHSAQLAAVDFVCSGVVAMAVQL